MPHTLAEKILLAAGPETGLYPADKTVAAYLDGRTDRPWTAERSDPDAETAGRVRIDLDQLPQPRPAALSSAEAVTLATPGAHVRIDTGTGEVTVDGAVVTPARCRRSSRR